MPRPLRKRRFLKPADNETPSTEEITSRHLRGRRERRRSRRSSSIERLRSRSRSVSRSRSPSQPTSYEASHDVSTISEEPTILSSSISVGQPVQTSTPQRPKGRKGRENDSRREPREPRETREPRQAEDPFGFDRVNNIHPSVLEPALSLPNDPIESLPSDDFIFSSSASEIPSSDGINSDSHEQIQPLEPKTISSLNTNQTTPSFQLLTVKELRDRMPLRPKRSFLNKENDHDEEAVLASHINIYGSGPENEDSSDSDYDPMPKPKAPAHHEPKLSAEELERIRKHNEVMKAKFAEIDKFELDEELQD